MDMDHIIDELLSQDKGLKKLIRKVTYKVLSPLINKFNNEYFNRTSQITEQFNRVLSENNDRISNLEINIRNNNDIISNLQTKSDIQDNQSKKLLDYAITIGEEVKKKKSSANLNTSEILAEVSQSSPSQDSYVGIDYFDFENRFRGSRELIKKVQEQYLGYYTDKKKVVDIGCGRGEFLELLKDHNIDAIGIDLYGKSIECCKLMGLNVLQKDAIGYLNNCESVDGVFAGQLVEHLTMEQIIQLCEVSYEKLEEDCYMILETPNPTSLAIYTHAFYMDPSHGKPVHPLTLQYCAQKAGFKDVQILYTESSLLPVSIPKLAGSNIENLKEFNDAMEIVSGTLFGSQDYAIIAKK